MTKKQLRPVRAAWRAWIWWRVDMVGCRTTQQTTQTIHGRVGTGPRYCRVSTARLHHLSGASLCACQRHRAAASAPDLCLSRGRRAEVECRVDHVREVRSPPPRRPVHVATLGGHEHHQVRVLMPIQPGACLWAGRNRSNVRVTECAMTPRVRPAGLRMVESREGCHSAGCSASGVSFGRGLRGTPCSPTGRSCRDRARGRPRRS